MIKIKKLDIVELFFVSTLIKAFEEGLPIFCPIE
jgi:hypothetical protein